MAIAAPQLDWIMTLLDVISALHSFNEEDTIYSQEPWTRDAMATVALEPSAGGLPTEASSLGLTYFLEIAIAKEVLEGWIQNRETFPSLGEMCDRVILYATYDA